MVLKLPAYMKLKKKHTIFILNNFLHAGRHEHGPSKFHPPATGPGLEHGHGLGEDRKSSYIANTADNLKESSITYQLCSPNLFQITSVTKSSKPCHSPAAFQNFNKLTSATIYSFSKNAEHYCHYSSQTQLLNEITGA